MSPLALRWTRVLALAALVSGCAAMPLKEAPPRYDFAVERQHMRSWSDTNLSPNPGLCLSFSGGGVRSGLFADGVISALAESGYLHHTDVMAGASGGSWGMYWFYDVALNSPELNPKDFAESSPNAEHLFQNANLIKSDVAASFGTDDTVLGRPANWEQNNVRKANRFVYQPYTSTFAQLIELTFTRDIAMRLHPNAPDWRGIVGALRLRRLPMPIVLLTATPGRLPPPKPYDRSLANYFELTPFGFGGPAMGEIFQDWDAQGFGSDFKGLAYAVAVSGAAIDAPFANEALKKPDFFRVAGSISFAADTKQPKEFYLADGGFTDNLAIYPNVLRHCSEIVIADATQDPSLQFTDLASTQYLLKGAGYELNVTGVLPVLSDCDMKIDLRSAAHPNICKPPPPNVWKRSDHLAFHGTVTGPDGYRARVTLLKLAAFEDSMRWDKFCGSLMNVCSKQPVTVACEGDGKEQHCAFPYESTMQQNMTPDQARGYFRMGRAAANEMLSSEPTHDNTTDAR